MNDGEKDALLIQVTMQITHTEKKLRGLGLNHIKVGLYDERTRQPVNNPQDIIDMAEGKPLPTGVSSLPAIAPNTKVEDE